ncbi:MAG TPA: FMN-binding protein, partial [Thermoguttaceae bacterium]|nr:FMN-binding protein [Thermoguttaceae bacterium]
PAGGQGFADRIEVLVGLDATVSTVKGLYVLDQKETPGLGDFIRGEDFRNQFVDKSAAENVVVVKTDPAPASNQITALSGATISSESVAQIVNDAIKNYQEAIRQQSLTPTE